jgi:very-short-patch-repair endonuclease
MARKLTTEDFIKKAKKVHGDKYDYSLVEYKTIFDKIKIICQTHGVFEQTPQNHLRNGGCYKCGNLKKSKTLNLTTKDFIKKAKKVHGDKYDYSLVEYNKSKTKIKIKCLEHGIFEQTPSSHLQGVGCPKCGWSRAAKVRALNKEDFIEKAKKTHDNKYDYSLVEYKNNSTKIKIICPDHGIFEQTPNGHTNISSKNGCPTCRASKGEKDIYRYLLNNNVEFEREKKFKDCKHKQKLPFDFYIPKYNMCIEYDGEQHFKPIEFLGGEEGLKQRQQNDKIKTNFCRSNNIKLLRIPYWKKNKISLILSEALNV